MTNLIEFTDDGKTPRCQEPSVTERGGWHWHQCSRPAKIGDYCKQHDPKTIAEKRRVQKAKFNVKWLETRKQLAGPRWYDVLKLIADGDDGGEDPWALAREALREFEDKS